MQKSRKLTDAELWAPLLLFLTVLFGGLVRIVPALLSDFPINDGGLFYVMTEQIRSRQYLLPATVTYNGFQIPFAYPPLGFYLAGLSADLFRTDLLDVFRWFPAVVSTLSLPAFYLLAKSLLDSAPKGALAALFFALLPRSVSWFLMGGGVTRALGQLFLILTIYSVFMTLARRSRRHLWLSMLFGGLVCLSHPEATIHAVAGCFLLMVCHGRSRRGLLDALLIISGVLVVASPWWITVLLRSGLQPFIAASQTGGHNTFFWLDLLLPIFAEESYLTLVTVLGLIGLAAELFKRRFFLPLWMAFPFVVEPRSAPAVAIFPLALLAAISVTEILLPGLALVSRRNEQTSSPAAEWIGLGNVTRLVLGYIAVMAFIGSYSFSLRLSGYHLSVADRSAMAWIRAHTPPESRFLLITGNSHPLSDPVQEWFPVLSGRRSQSTLQGLEWLAGKDFEPRMMRLTALQSCANREADCLSAWAANANVGFDYVYVERFELTASFPSNSLPEVPALLLASLRRSEDYELVYESESVYIFRVKASSALSSNYFF